MPPRVLLATCSGRSIGPGDAVECFYRALLPPNSHRLRARGAMISRQMSAIIEQAIEGGYDYLFYVDDDLTFDADVIHRMVSHQKERITPLVCQRTAPYQPYLFESCSDKGMHFMSLVHSPELKGVIRVPYGICGAPGLTAVSALKKLPKPYFPENEVDAQGVFRQGDILFTRNMHNAGVESWCDLDVAFGHIGECSVSLKWTEQGYAASVELPEG